MTDELTERHFDPKDYPTRASLPDDIMNGEYMNWLIDWAELKLDQQEQSDEG